MERRQSQKMDLEALLADLEDASWLADSLKYMQGEGPFAMRHLDDLILENEDEPETNLGSIPEKRLPQIYHESPLLNWTWCPSRTSSGTLSSEPSTGSSMSLESIAQQINGPSSEDANSTSVMGINGSPSAQNAHFTAQVVGLCPWKNCERHLRGFTKAGDRERHMLEHCDTTLVCDFCPEDEDQVTAFGRGADRVSRFLEHLCRNHDANETEGSDELPIPPGYKVPVRLGKWRCRDGPRAECPICAESFTAGAMYRHVPNCVCLEVTAMAGSSIRTYREHQDLECSASDGAMRDQTNPTTQIEERPQIHEAQDDSRKPLASVYSRSADISELTASSNCLSPVSSRAATSSEEETDCSEEMASRESSPAVSQIPSQITPTKRRLVDAIMQEFHEVFSATLRSHATDGSISSSNGSTTGNSTGASTYSTASFISRKRSLSGGGSTPPDDGDDSNKRRRPDSVSKDKQPVSELRFACPYYKRNPGRHQTFTSCRDPGFTTVARLKEHLYRRHLLAPQCHRCCITFTNDIALRVHQRDPSGCELREQIPLEGFDKEQEKRMKSKKGSQMHHNEVDKWKAVYRILFPDDHDADMPSPYIEYQRGTTGVGEQSNSTGFQEFSRLELPRLVRRTLESIVEHEAQPLEDKLKERLVDIVKQCQAQLETMFQTAAGPSNTRAEASLNSGAQPSGHIVERPIDMHLPTTVVSVVSTDLPATSKAIPPQPQPQEASYQRESLSETVDPVSDSSDSGYDSISLAALSATTVHNELPQEYFDPNQYLDLSDYPHFPEVTTDTTVHVAPTHTNNDDSIWPLVDSFPGINNANLDEPDYVHYSEHVWQY